jgi:hypothetical protein
VFEVVHKPVRLGELAATVQRAYFAAAQRRGRGGAHAGHRATLLAQARALLQEVEGVAHFAAAVARGAGPVANATWLLAAIEDELPLLPIRRLTDLIERQTEPATNAQLAEYAAQIRESGERLKQTAERFAMLNVLNFRAAPPHLTLGPTGSGLAALRMREPRLAQQPDQTLKATPAAAPTV